MKKFDLKKMIAENKATFFSSLNENASNTAEKFAQYMSKKEGKTFTVTPGSVDEKSSAYLSGRGVKVCKGQMSGKSKKKK